jgi:hypothetical protein
VKDCLLRSGSKRLLPPISLLSAIAVAVPGHPSHDMLWVIEETVAKEAKSGA